MFSLERDGLVEILIEKWWKCSPRIVKKILSNIIHLLEIHFFLHSKTNVSEESSIEFSKNDFFFLIKEMSWQFENLYLRGEKKANFSFLLLYGRDALNSSLKPDLNKKKAVRLYLCNQRTALGCFSLSYRRPC